MAPARLAVVAWVALASTLAAGCEVGVGTGEALGDVHAPGCGVDGAFDLAPTFFVAEEFESKLEIRMQRSGDYEIYSDGISVGVADAGQVLEVLGTPIELDASRDALVTMNFFANETCPLTRMRDVSIPVNYIAISGTITFFSLFAPGINNERRIFASFDNVRFVDPSDPDQRFALFSGSFDFLYNRGRPAQRFP